MFLIKSIPPPFHSDGNIESIRIAAQNGFTEANNYVSAFFQTIQFPLMELCCSFPNQFNLPPGVQIDNFDPSASLERLPTNYGLFTQLSTGNLVVLGHPSGKFYQSALDMLPHIVWLVSSDRSSVPCSCRLCSFQKTYSPTSKDHSEYKAMYSNFDQKLPPQFPQSLPKMLPNGQVEYYPQPLAFGDPNMLHLGMNQRGSLKSSPIEPTPSTPTQSPSPKNPKSTLVNINVSKGNTPGPASVTNNIEPQSSTDDLKFKSKYVAAKAEADTLEKELEKLQNSIDDAYKSIARLKFEKRLLLGAIMAGDPVSAKRALEESSDNDSFIYDISEVEHDSPSELDDEEGDPEFEGSAPKIRQKKKKRMKLLDPNAPKRPANAFILFCELQRMCIKEERRLINKKAPGSELDLQLSNLTKALGARWRQLSEVDRKVYQDMFKDQVKQYDTDLAEYMSLHPNAPLEDAEIASLPKGWTDPDAPKRPANPFFVFCEMEDERLRTERKLGKTPEEDEMELNKISKSLGERWRLLTEAERQRIFPPNLVYIDKYEEQLAAYRKYMNEKKASIPAPSNQTQISKENDISESVLNEISQSYN